ncbi:liver carboxylesterase 1 [Piliocolobus tephrosceles]|uniref:liver carboxylesterase 1 n=1 Tax=Piliocolobus tephrosceles TaxID=591936 RepID=UPI000E6B2BF6|nr:liver carboxylesterase 1 [Piliocolobus tephrosceles]
MEDNHIVDLNNNTLLLHSRAVAQGGAELLAGQRSPDQLQEDLAGPETSGPSRMWLRALVLGTLAASMVWGHPSSPPVVDTVHGKVLGKFVSLEGFAQPVAVFLGIPFAKPPLGPLRFTPPQPAEPWSFVKNATSYPPMPSRARVLPTSSGPSQLGTKRENLTPLLLHPPSSVFSWEASHPHPLSWSSQNFLTLDLHGDPRKSYPRTPTVIDGVVLPKTPEELQAERKFHTVPYIVGFNKKEFGWFLPTLMSYPLSEGKLDQKTAMSLLWKSYPLVHIPKELIPEATEKYLGGTVDPVKKKDLFLDLIADVMFCVPSVIVARHHRDAGAPTYMYEFQYRPSFSSDMKPKTVIGDHGDEIFSVLGAPFLKEGASEEEIRLSKMVMKFWANFARNGNPNGEGLPHWPEYNQEEGYLQIGANTQAAQKLKDKEVAFWTNLFKKAAEQLPQTEHIEL